MINRRDFAKLTAMAACAVYGSGSLSESETESSGQAAPSEFSIELQEGEILLLPQGWRMEPLKIGTYAIKPGAMTVVDGQAAVECKIDTRIDEDAFEKIITRLQEPESTDR